MPGVVVGRMAFQRIGRHLAILVYIQKGDLIAAVYFGNFAKQRKGGILIGVNIAVQKAASI